MTNRYEQNGDIFYCKVQTLLAFTKNKVTNVFLFPVIFVKKTIPASVESFSMFSEGSFIS